MIKQLFSLIVARCYVKTAQTHTLTYSERDRLKTYIFMCSKHVCKRYWMWTANQHQQQQ